jgi:hypothetical protein
MIDDAPEPDLQAICDVCLQPIADGEGHVWADSREADEVLRNTPTPEGSQDLHEFLEGSPDDAPWHTTHAACQDSPAGAYSIAVERIRTWPAYLHWCAHLMGKAWIEGTDWQEFVLRSLEPHLAATSGLRPTKPQSLQWQGIGGWPVVE